MDYLVLAGCGLTRSDAAKVLPLVLLVCQRGCKRSANPLHIFCLSFWAKDMNDPDGLNLEARKSYRIKIWFICKKSNIHTFVFFPCLSIFQSIAPTLIPIPTRLALSLFAFHSATTVCALPKFLSLLRPPPTPHAMLGLFNQRSEACAWYLWVELMIADACSIKLTAPAHICHILLQ